MDPDIAALLTELVEKVGLLRGDMKKKNDLEKYEARFARVEQKLSALAERISRTDPDLAKRLSTAWQLPGRSLAFRNAEHQKTREREGEDTQHAAEDGTQTPEDGT
jgi:hypothetical protein